MQNNEAYAQMRKEFQDSYFKLVPYLEQFEKERKIRCFIELVLVSLVFISFFIIGVINPLTVAETRVLAAIPTVFIGLLLISVCQEVDFHSRIKRKIMPAVCKCFGDLKWEEGYYNYEKENFAEVGLIPTYTYSTYDDIFYGKHNRVPFKILESTFTYSKRYHYGDKTVFSGVIVRLPMNKNFHGNTVIRPDSLMHISPNSNLKHTVLEDVVFEKKFDVFTDDEVEARFLITPLFMERLNNMKTAFKADNVSCAFYKNELMIALSIQKDLFSLCSLSTPMTDEKQFFTMFEEILSIIKLIDYFKLNQKIGM